MGSIGIRVTSCGSERRASGLTAWNSQKSSTEQGKSSLVLLNLQSDREWGKRKANFKGLFQATLSSSEDAVPAVRLWSSGNGCGVVSVYGP
jgi:hypothetical protein